MANQKRKNIVNQKRESNSKQKRMIRDIIWKLPEEITNLIFSKLPFSDLPNCRIVCKAWNHIILDYASKFHINPNAYLFYISDFDLYPLSYGYDHFQHLNPQMSCIDFDTTSSSATLTFDRDCKSVEICTSCNGLLHILKWMSTSVRCSGIWNPMTNEFFKIPGSDRKEDNYSYGFGFSPKTKKYKLFRIAQGDCVLSSIIEVWRFGISNRWEHLGCWPFYILDHATYLDGVIYWFGYDSSKMSIIYALDVEMETLGIDAILDLGTCSIAKSQPFNGTICLIVFYYLKEEVWVRRAKDSWTRELIIDLPIERKFYYIKAFEEEREIYFLAGNDLFCLDKNGKKIDMKTLFNPNEKEIQCVVHIEAFQFGSLQKILCGNTTETLLSFV